MFRVVKPHPNLDGVALPDPVEDVLHLVLAVLVLPDLVVVLVVLRGGRWPGVEGPGVACSAPPDSLETHSLLSSHVTQIPLLLLFTHSCLFLPFLAPLISSPTALSLLLQPAVVAAR